jgi:hypothetical protein
MIFLLRSAKKRTSVAKAVKRVGFYGTAEPVPFVQRCFRADGRSQCDTAEQAAEKLGFISGHDFSRAVHDGEYVGL